MYGACAGEEVEQLRCCMHHVLAYFALAQPAMPQDWFDGLTFAWLFRNTFFLWCTPIVHVPLPAKVHADTSTDASAQVGFEEATGHVQINRPALSGSLRISCFFLEYFMKAPAHSLTSCCTGTTPFLRASSTTILTNIRKLPPISPCTSGTANSGISDPCPGKHV